MASNPLANDQINRSRGEHNAGGEYGIDSEYATIVNKAVQSAHPPGPGYKTLAKGGPLARKRRY